MKNEHIASDGDQVPSQEAVEPFLVVSSGNLRCALPANMVRQVVRSLSSFPVPGSQPHLLGLAQFAGEPLAVLDLHALVTDGLPGAAHRATVILGREAEDAMRVLGLAVDEAVGVTALEVGTRQEDASSLVVTIVTIDGHPVKIVDPSVLFSENWKPRNRRV